MYQYCYLFLLFIIYSFLGYLVEIFNCSRIERRIVLNRGFFLGPVLPIYGVSCLIMVQFLDRYKSDLLVLFIMSMVISALLEYFTSYILEKIFKTRWWDYSEKRFNIEGRICLGNIFLFGLGGTICVYLVNPLFVSFLAIFKEQTIIIVSLFLFVIFLADVLIILITMWQLKIASKKFKTKDATEEITKIVRDEIIKNAALLRRMLNAFPKINIQNRKDVLSKLKAVLQAKKEVKKVQKSYKKEDQ